MNFKIIILVFTAVFFIIMSACTGHPGGGTRPVVNEKKTINRPLLAVAPLAQYPPAPPPQQNPAPPPPRQVPVPRPPQRQNPPPRP
ncbi:uncharacterized proline-rich protein-like [Adelges cooleyi]|uniref:uncharacterized proline-rich protein-like n=1 Tax=Adelges cooleyi TaxID=133065 RepID=UPI002180001C|nr:uncharacterized proline-rich protein-like [Adelges cooleyi]XP_050433848.1 uncharacterized proline-rich protein-like [Adelges cooleyi]